MEVRDRNLMEILLRSEFDRAKRYNLPLSCIMLCVVDLTKDDKKRGMNFLDAILEESVALLSGMVRTSDIVALYSKDRLLILMPMVNTDTTSFVAQRIHRLFTQHSFTERHYAAKMSVSMGIASASDKDVNSPEDLMRCAETALKQAQAQGGNTLCLWRDITE